MIISTSSEKWQKVPNYPGYEVSNCGTLPGRISKRVSKPVISIDADGNEKYYKSITSAAKEFGGYAGNICAVLSGRTHTAWGRTWRLADD